MDHFPIFLNLTGRRVLVVGGGEVAARKATLLASAGARVHVVAPRIGTALRRLIDTGHSCRNGRFRPNDLDGVTLVIAATGSRAVNAGVAAAAETRFLPVNVVDDPALCSFVMPAIIDRGRLLVAVSSGGASPVLARLVRTRLDTMLPAGIGRLLDLAAAWRERVKAALPDTVTRRRFWERFLAAGDASIADPEALLAVAEGSGGRLDVVTVPCAVPDMISLRAIRLIAAADIILHDPSVPEEVLDFARRDADRRMLEGVLEEAADDDVAAGRRVVVLQAAGQT